MSKFTGNIIRLPAVTPTQNSASGVYTLDDQFTAQSSGTWPIVRDQYFNYTTLLLTGAVQGTAYPNPVTQPYSFLSDASTNNFVVSPNGDVSARPFNPYLNNYSVLLNGSSGYLSSGAASIGSNNFTVEAWVYLNSNANYAGVFSSIEQTTGTGVFIGFQNTGALIGIVGNGNSSGGANGQLIGSTAVSTNTWNHIAFVRNGTSITLFLNGTIYATATTSSVFSVTSTSAVVGRYYVSTNNFYLNGYVSNVRVLNGTALYTSSFIPPTQPLQNITNTAYLTCQSNRFIDNSTANSGSGFTITPNGTPAVSQNSPFVSYDTTNGSGYFDGTGDWLYTGTGLPSLGTSDFTIEMWIYPTTFASITYPLFSTNNGAKANVMALEIQTLGDLYWYVTGTTTWSITSASVGTLTLNQWSHIAFTRSGTSFKAYINGKYIQGAATSSQSVAAFNGFNIGQNGIPGGYFTGYMSSIRYVIGSAVYTGDFTPPTAPLTPVSGTQLLTLQTRAPATNNGFIDSSPNNFVVTRNGNTTQGSFSPFSPTGWSVLNSATSCLAAGSASDWTFLTNTTALWTIEMWVYPTVSGTAMILADNNDFNSANVGINFFKNASNQVQLNICRGVGGSLVVQFTSTGTLNINAWNNIVITYDQSLASQNLKFYLNGASAETANKTANAPSNSAAPGTLTIGRYRTAASDGVVGYLGSLRISNIVRTPSGVPTSAYTSDANTKLLICQYNRFLDGSANNYTLTVTNSPSVQAFSPFAPAQSYIPSQIGGSGYFDGTGSGTAADYLTVPDSPAFTLGSGDFTLETWIYSTVGSGAERYYIAHTDNATAAASQFAFYQRSADAFILFEYYVSTTANSITSGAAITLNQWNHIAVCRSNGTLSMFVNGVRPATGTTNISTTAFNDSASSLGIGGRTSGAALLTGNISGMRLVRGTDIYGASNTTITVPTAPPTAIPNTSLLLNFTNGGIVDATGKNIIETLGNATQSTAQSKWSNSGSFLNNGAAGSRFQVSSSSAPPLFNVGSGDYTVEFWVNTGTPASQQCILDFRNADVAGQGYALIFNTSRQIIMYYNVGNRITTSAISANVWTHVAVVRYNGVYTIYVDGSASGGTYNNSDAVAPPANRPLIGSVSDGSQVFNGNFSNFRISRIARYTSNFNTNLPTGPFPLG